MVRSLSCPAEEAPERRQGCPETDGLCSTQAPILLAITDMALQLGLFYKFTARGSIKISRYQVRLPSGCAANCSCGGVSARIIRGLGDPPQKVRGRIH